MRTYTSVVGALVVGGMLAATGRADAPAAPQERALTAARAWLKVVDAGNYGKGWGSAAALLKRAVKREDFVQSLRASRAPLGRLISRKLQSKRYLTELPGAPDGHYVVLVFSSVFENKKSAKETITPMRDPDGRWRVSGYYIK